MNKPLAKSLADIKVGEKSLQHGKDAFDYSHILEQHHRDALPGAKIIVKWVPGDGPPGDESGWINATLHDPAGKHLGSVEGDVYERDGDGRKFFAVSSAHLRGVPREFNGRKLYFGRKLYEAAMAHAMNAVGATHVGGGAHSTYASLAHRWLADKHGMLYDPMANTKGNADLYDPAVAMLGTGRPYGEDSWGYEGQAPESNDDRYGPYAYTMKKEGDMGLAGVPIGAHKTAGAAHHYDYDHLLSGDHLKDGYRLEVLSYPRPGGKDVGVVRARVRGPFHTGQHDYAAQVEGVYEHPSFHISFSNTDREHQGRGLGRACYEALMAHMKNLHGATELRGDEHTYKADKAHRALANKYGLRWAVEPQPLPVKQMEEQGSFSPYALKLHEAVTDGEFEIRLAKDEVDQADPVVQRINALFEYTPYSYDVRALMNENGTTKQHVAYILKKCADKLKPNSELDHNILEVTSFCVDNRHFDKALYDEMVQGADADRGLNALRRNLLWSHQQGYGRWASQHPDEAWDYFADQAVHQVNHDEAINNNEAPDAVKISEDALGRSHNVAMGLIFNNSSYVKKDTVGKYELDHRRGSQGYRENFLSVFDTHYMRAPEAVEGQPPPQVPVMPDDVKTRFLNYTKRLTKSFEKAKNVNRNPGAAIWDEFTAIEPSLKKVVDSGLPEEFIKGRLSKDMFSSFLCRAPNFPQKKTAAIMDHFFSPEGAAKLGNDAARKTLAKMWLTHPNLSDSQWESLLQAHAGSLPYTDVVASHRFTIDLAQKLWMKHQSLDLLKSMKNTNKLTPEFQSFLEQNLLPPTKEQEVAAKIAEVTANVPANYTMTDGILKHQWGSMHEAFQQNPFKFDDNVSQIMKATGIAPTVEFFHKYVDRYKKMYTYLPEGVAPHTRAANFGNGWGIASGYYDQPSDRPFTMARIMQQNGVSDPAIDKALADYIVGLNNIKLGDPAMGWIHEVKDEETIQHLLKNANKAQVIDSLLARDDAKPEWLATVEARPEFTDTHGNPNFQHNEPLHDPYLENGDNFRNSIRESVFNSRAFPADRIDSVVRNATSLNDAARFMDHQGMKPETFDWLLDQTPTVFGGPKRDERGNYVIDNRTGDYVREVTSQGTVPWKEAEHSGLLSTFVTNQMRKLTPEHWRKLRDKGYLATYEGAKPGSENNARRMQSYALSGQQGLENVPTDVLQYLHGQLTGPMGKNDYRSAEMVKRLLAHPNVSPELLQNLIENTPDAQMTGTFPSLLGNGKLTPELVDKMVSRVSAICPAVGELNLSPDGQPLGVDDKLDLRHYFWTAFAKSRYATDEWLDGVAAKMAEQDAKVTEWNRANPTRQSYHNWSDLDFGQVVRENVAMSNPDAIYTAHQKIPVKFGSHPLRILRNTIEAAGGQIHIGELQKHPVFSKLPFDKARVVREMTPEEYEKKFAKTPPNKRPPPGNLKVKTDFVSAQGVQQIIDQMPVHNTWNVSEKDWAEYRPQMSHPTARNNVFQFNITTDHIKKMKEAGVFWVWKKLKGGPLRGGGIHPMTGDTIGWIRHYGVAPDNTVTVDECQSDIRPPVTSWVQTLKGARGQLPGQNGNGWQGQVINNVVNNGMWGGNFPAEEMDKLFEIIIGKGKDVHEAMQEGLLQHLRNQGHDNVTLRMPDVGLQASQRYGWAGVPEAQRATLPIPPPENNLQSLGIRQDAPKHLYETHDAIPTRLGFDMRSGKYGEAAMEPNPKHKGWPMHTTKVSKMEPKWDAWENLCKGIETLPNLPMIRTTGGERFYDASHYLSPEHREQGYSMQVRTHHGVYGKHSAVEVHHGANLVGGVEGFIDGKTAQIALSSLKDQHTGKGLGGPMYEALMASAKAHWGATHIRGLTHSSMAHGVHRKLAEKHGLNYVAEPNVPSARYPDMESWTSAPNKPLDSKYRSYAYTL